MGTFGGGVHTLVVLILFCIGFVLASSSPARPLKRLTEPSTLALEILPRRPAFGSHKTRSDSLLSPVLRHTDSFRLTLSVFDKVYHLHLRPNDHLIHPAARVSYYSTAEDGSTVLDRTEPLVRESVRAYWGEVIPAHESVPRMREDVAGAPSRQHELGWARIMVHDQGDIVKGSPPVYEGAFSVEGVVHHIMTKDNYFRHKRDLDSPIVVVPEESDSPLVIWRDSDVMSRLEEHVAQSGVPVDEAELPPAAHSCGHDSLAYNTDPALNPSLRKNDMSPWYDALGVFNPFFPLGKRDDVAGGNSSSTSNFVNNIGSSAGCSQTQKIVYMGVAADCAYTQYYDTPSNATQQILNNWNMASAQYKSTFNVSLGIIELQIQNSSCPATADPATPWNVNCSSSITLNDRLSIFSAWRGNQTDDAGLWHLMSGCPTGSEVGVAWLGTLCQQSASGSDPSVVSGTAVSTAGRTEWQVVAHEIGHNFGAIHDCTTGCNSTTNCCPQSASTCDAGGSFIMNPTTSSSETQFSPCTLGNICSLMQGNGGSKTNTTCLVDPSASQQQIISLNMCGNGIVEEGEECDTGPGANSTCCDSSTCKFTSGSVCDPLNGRCCTDSCQFAASTQVCRPSQDATCDTPEMCSGNNATCPPDLFAANGKSCGSNGLACASGQCTSLSLQCQNVGASMNLQQACPSAGDKTCQISCADPTQASQCVTLQAQVVDGSPCGYAGTCLGGSCHAGSLLDTAKAWYTQNLSISIPITIGVAVVFLLLFYSLFLAGKRCCCSPRNKRPGWEPELTNQPPAGQRTRKSFWGGKPPLMTVLPPSLQAGLSRPGAPPSVHSRNASSASSLMSRRTNSPAPSLINGRTVAPGRTRSPPTNQQTHWVDARQWNGPSHGY